MKLFVATAIACAICTPSLADVNVAFIEGAPKDTFVLTNVGTCELVMPEITVDLSGSAAGLIFDVSDAGPGVEVSQPFQMVSGQDLLTDMPIISDGDKSITLPLQGLGRDQTVAFTIDIDDTAGAREITVSDQEIVGASVTIKTSKDVFSSSFEDGSETKVRIPGCSA